MGCLIEWPHMRSWAKHDGASWLVCAPEIAEGEAILRALLRDEGIGLTLEEVAESSAGILTRYDENQERDDNGRWTSGGGASSSPGGKDFAYKEMTTPGSSTRVRFPTPAEKRLAAEWLAGRVLGPEDGFSWQPASDRIPTEGKMVGVKTRWVGEAKEVTPQLIAKLALTTPPGRFLGGWYDRGEKASGKVFFDEVIDAGTDEKAVELGAKYDQIGYYDLKTETYHELDRKAGGVARSFDDGGYDGSDDDSDSSGADRRGGGQGLRGYDREEAYRGGDEGGGGDPGEGSEALQLRFLKFLTRYSEDQPRDEDGRWTSDGGSSSSSSGEKGANPAGSGVSTSASKGEKLAKEKTVKPSTGKEYTPDVLADENGDGITEAARVGVSAFSTPPPPSVPRMPNLTERERAVEEAFASRYEADPQKMIDEYNQMRLAGKTGNPPNTFGTDDVKVLDPGWSPPDGDPKNLSQETKDFRSQFNVALHATANSVAKTAFLQELDRIAALPADQRTCLVTAGGCGAGKGHAIKNVDDAKSVAAKVAAVWDSAGDQNGTENAWVLEEAERRGIKPTFMYVHADPEKIWADESRGVVQRANQQGRMVDAAVFVDSHVIGAQNFKAFQAANSHRANFIVIDNTGKAPVRVDTVPDKAVNVDRGKLLKFCDDVVSERYRSGKINAAIARGALLHKRLWPGG